MYDSQEHIYAVNLVSIMPMLSSTHLALFWALHNFWSTKFFISRLPKLDLSAAKGKLVLPFMFIIWYLNHGIAIIVNVALLGYFTSDRFHYELYPHLVWVPENSLRDTV